MATSTFEREIVFDDKNSIRRFSRIMSDKVKSKPISVSPYTQEERNRSERLLRQALNRSNDSKTLTQN